MFEELCTCTNVPMKRYKYEPKDHLDSQFLQGKQTSSLERRNIAKGRIYVVLYQTHRHIKKRLF